MNAIGRAKLYGAGITSPEMVHHLIDHATAKATPAPRITRSRRVRRWKGVAIRIAFAAAVLYVIGAYL